MSTAASTPSPPPVPVANPPSSVAGMAQLQPGDDAPDFTLLDQSGTAVSLSDLKGRKILLYFYPKAGTPG